MFFDTYKPLIIKKVREFIKNEYKHKGQKFMYKFIDKEIYNINSPYELYKFFEKLIKKYILHAWTDFKLRDTTYYKQYLKTQYFQDADQMDNEFFSIIVNTRLQTFINDLLNSTLKKHACSIIENAWLECHYNPNYLVCQNRLRTEYQEYVLEYNNLLQ